MDWQQQFGLPFTYPYPGLEQPQQQAQTAQPDGQGGPSDQYQPPAADAFSNPWQIQGLNLQAYGQNTQQSQYPAAAWPPPPVPTPDAWNQLQQHLPFLMHNGLIPPPPIPGLNIPPARMPQAPVQNAAPPNAIPTPPVHPAQPVPPTQQPVTATNDRHMEVIDSDKEDGEVSEKDRMSQSPAGNGRAYMEPPRSVPRSNVRPEAKPTNGQQEPYNPDRPAAGQMFQAPAQHEKKQAQAANTSINVPHLREEAKKFVKLLHQHNIGYRALADEGLDPGPLRDLYRSLNLPSEPEPVPPPKPSATVPSGLTNGEAAAAHPVPPNANGTKPTTSVKTNVAAAPPVKSAPSPVDRKDYIARLQAAKMGKQSAGTKGTPPQKTPPATSTVSQTVKTPQPITTADAGRPLTEEEKKARTTELIRQRLEALKNSSSPAAPPVPKPPVVETASNAGSAFSPVPNLQSSPSSTNIQKPQLTQMPSFSGIPGLFMNSLTTAQPIQAPSPPRPTAEGVAPRKRPLASDFIDPTTSSNIDAGQTGYLGASVNGNDRESMDIEASDGESGRSEMDMSDEHTSKLTVALSAPHRNIPPSSRTLPTIPDFPSRPTSVNPPLSTVSTPGPQTPASLARTGQLQRTEKELADLKLRLQERLKEQRRQKALAAATSSPGPTKAIQEVSAQPVAQPAHGSQGSALPSASNGAQEISRESKRRRRAEIESGLPSLDAEIATNAARMAQLTKEMEQLTANNERMKQDKERLIHELESLGIDTEGMPHAELQAKKDEIESERQAVSGGRATSPELPTPSFDRLETEARSPVALEPTPAEPQARAVSTEAQRPQSSRPAEGVSPVQHMGIPGLRASIAQHPSILPIPPSTMPQDIPEPEIEPKELNHASTLGMTQPEVVPHPVTSVDALEATKRAGLQESATPIDDDEDFYSPEPTDNIPPIEQPDVNQITQADAQSPSDEGEVAMSESEEEEEYEPEEPQSLPELMVPGTANHSATVESSSASSITSSSLSEDEEAYEPPDVDKPMLDVQPTQSTAGPDMVTQQGETEDGAMEISMSSDDEFDGSDSSSQSAGENFAREVPPANDVEQPIAVADDLAPELQAESAAAIALTAHDLTAPAENDAELTRFVPYESPLKQFKSYRYHPSFPQEVPGGFLSMTYSHQIDPNQPLCPAESVGAPCSDPQCLGQHFRGMNITGDKLLVQLGTANPGKTPEERQLWNDGLRGILKELRSKNTKDPNGIAMEIAKFRREFLKDDTRVVNL